MQVGCIARRWDSGTVKILCSVFKKVLGKTAKRVLGKKGAAGQNRVLGLGSVGPGGGSGGGPLIWQQPCGRRGAQT